MTIYIDSNYCCHLENDSTMQAIEVAAFDGKCQTFVEGYRFIPPDNSWTNPNGTVFKGEMMAPCKPYKELAAAQAEYEKAQAEIEEMLALLESGVTE